MIRTGLRPGDWLVLASLVALTAWLTLSLWQGGAARDVVIRASGQPYRTVSLLHDQIIAVPGPLGITEVEIAHGRARIRRDPSPRQYCVKQGWLEHAGQIALCLPNATSIELTAPDAPYDSLSF